MPKQQAERKRLSAADKTSILSTIESLKSFHEEGSSSLFRIEHHFEHIRQIFCDDYARKDPSLQALCTDEAIVAIHEKGVPGVSGGPTNQFSAELIQPNRSQESKKKRPLLSISPEEVEAAKVRRLESESTAQHSKEMKRMIGDSLKPTFNLLNVSYSQLPTASDNLSSDEVDRIHSWQDNAAKLAQQLHDFPALNNLQTQLHVKRQELAERYPEVPLSLEFMKYHSTQPLTAGSVQDLASFTFTSAPSSVPAASNYRKQPRPGKKDPSQVSDLTASIYKRCKGIANNLGQVCMRIDEHHKSVGYTVPPHGLIPATDEEVKTLDTTILSTVNSLKNLLSQRREMKPYMKDMGKSCGVAFVNRNKQGSCRVIDNNVTDDGLVLVAEVLNGMFSKNTGKANRVLSRRCGGSQRGPAGGSSHHYTEIGQKAIAAVLPESSGTNNEEDREDGVGEGEQDRRRRQCR